MASAMIRQRTLSPELYEEFDRVTLWVANLAAPKDIWSLREAVMWADTHPDRARIVLFRPPGAGERAIWLDTVQINALAAAARNAA